MQKQNVDPINIQHKCSVIIKKPKYLLNDGFSWIIAAIENGKLNENSTEQDIFNLKLELVKETETRLGQFLRSDSNKKGILFDPCPSCIDIPYFIVGDNLNRINWQSGNYITDNLSSSNDRILNCTVTQEINNGWTCNFTLDNTDDIYTLNNYYKLNFKQEVSYGDYVLNQNNICVIEPNDEIEVYMSDWQGILHCVFTGFVSNVTKTDDGLRKVINVSCNDILKKLSWHYLNAQAGFDIKEARGVALAVYGENYQSFTLNEVLSVLLGETYCDVYKRDSFLVELVHIYAQAYAKMKKYKSGQETAEARKSQNKAIENINKKLLEEINKYIEIDYAYKETTVLGQKQYVLTNSEEGRLGRKCTIDYEQIINTGKTEDDVIVKKQTPFVDPDKGEIAFKIEGESQPVWEWTVKQGGYDYLFSNYKKNDDFVRNIASITQYEFYANETGIIYFRPPNFVLPRGSLLESMAEDTTVQQANKYIKDNYWVTQDKEQYFTQINSSINDNNIYTRVNVIGKWVELGYSNEFMRAAGYASQWWLNKYGLRIMSTATRTGLKDEKTCKTYAEMLLWKNNINYELCDATCVLNSNYTVGVPIYLEKQLAVWYIGRVTHTFNSGNSCTTNLTLTYKRTPMCLRKDLDKYLNDNLNWGKINQVEYDYIKKYNELLTWGRLNISARIVGITKGIAQAAGIQNAGEQKLIGTKTLNNRDYYFIWTPIPDSLYLLTLELQNQVDTINNNQSNRGKTIKNTKIKSKKTVYVFGAEGSETAFTEETYLSAGDRYRANMSKSENERKIRKENDFTHPIISQTKSVASKFYNAATTLIYKPTNNIVKTIEREPMLNKLGAYLYED